MGLARCLRVRRIHYVRSRALIVMLALSTILTAANPDFLSAQHRDSLDTTEQLSSITEPVSELAREPQHSSVSKQFLRGRSVESRTASVRARTTQGSEALVSSAYAMSLARQQHAAMVVAQNLVTSKLSSLSAAWESVGPASVLTAAYGKVSGRVTAVAIDPADLTGNTVYLGSTGGGVWKSTNAMGPVASVTFTPLTDTLPVFNADAGAVAIPSLSIGALSVQGGIVLAGTGDPNDAADSYYGSGLLRSADGGLTWTLVQSSARDELNLTHSFVGLGFAGFAWSSTVPGLVVAAVSQSAEGTLVNAGDASNSVMGLYSSSDYGVTWQLATVMDGSQIVQGPQYALQPQVGNAATSVVWNPVRRRFFAALRFHGYYESTDGANWTRLAAQPGSGLSGAACLSGLAACPLFRGVLAVQSTTGDTFALTVDRNTIDQGLWQDVCHASNGACGGAVSFANRLGGIALDTSGSSAIFQGDYNLSLAAVAVTAANTTPADTLLYVGTVDLYRCSLAAGCALRNTTNAVNGCAAPAKVASAQHAIAGMATSGQPILFLGNDGGLWRSQDGVNQQAAVCSADDATHFDNLNGGLGSLAEVVSFAQHPTDAAQLLVGLGANGSAGTKSYAAGLWNQLNAGEGGVVGIDSTNPALWYVSTAAGVSVKTCTSGPDCTATDFAGAATIGAAQVSRDASLIDAPWLLDPLQPAELIVGTCRIWRGPVAHGDQWSSANAISRMLGGTAGAACGTVNPAIRSLATGGATSSATSAQNTGSQVLYAGMAGVLDGGGILGGHVFTTTAGATANATTTWIDTAASPVSDGSASSDRFNPGGFDISSLTVDAHDVTGKTVYATVMGFAGNGVKAPHLYRSTDGGAHWANISSNLPNAPANSVVVDPNDANTLYVALDTGVYVTTQVANCVLLTCWSVYGAGLPNSPVVELLIAGGMASGDGRTGELRAGTYGRGIWQIPLLTAVSSSSPAMTLDSTSLTFSTQPVGTLSTSQTVTVTNSGNATLNVSQIVTTGDFHTTDTCIGLPLAAGQSCRVSVSFLPSAIGARSGLLTILGNVAGGQVTVSLSGAAVAGAAVVLTPVTVSFAPTAISATSLAQNISISNTGGVLATVGTIAVSGDFILTANTCGTTLAPSVGCTVAVAFRPVATGVRSGALTVGTNSGTLTAILSGSGTSPATDALSPLALTFSAQQLNTTSVSEKITLTNAGDVALTLIAAQISAGDFAVVNSCGNSLSPHSTCTMSVSFIPKNVGQQSGSLTITDQLRSQTVALNGTGIAPAGVSLSPFFSLAFGPTGVGLSSVAQPVTLTNNGGSSLSIAAATVTGDFAIVPGSNTCAGTVVVGGTCTMQIAFVPVAGGPRNGTLAVKNSAAGSPQTITLSGAGVDFTLAANGSTSVAIASGQNAVFPLLLSSAANVAGTVTTTCSGVPANSICTVSPSSVALGGVTTVSVTINTGVTVTATGHNSPSSKSLIWLACLVPISAVLRRRRRSALLLLCLLAGCGSGRHIPTNASAGGSTSPVTASGNYSIVVSAASAGLVRTVNLTLIIQ
jgi:hypothetical protein